jgi:hypothetical protein
MASSTTEQGEGGQLPEELLVMNERGAARHESSTIGLLLPSSTTEEG